MNMSMKKEAFFNSIQTVYKDYRENPEESRRIHADMDASYGKGWIKKYYHITERSCREFLWRLRDLGLEGVGFDEFPVICYLDGEVQKHFTFDIVVTKEIGNCIIIYINSTGEVNVCTDNGIDKYKMKTNKELIEFAKIFREKYGF